MVKDYAVVFFFLKLATQLPHEGFFFLLPLVYLKISLIWHTNYVKFYDIICFMNLLVLFWRDFSKWLSNESISGFSFTEK